MYFISEQDAAELLQYLRKERPISDHDHAGIIANAENIVKNWEFDLTKSIRNRHKDLDPELMSSRKGVLESWIPKSRNDYPKWEVVKPTVSLGLSDYMDDFKRKTPRKMAMAIGHLKNIASVQSDIMSMLQRVEESSRENTNCTAQNLEGQQAAIAEIEMSLAEPELPDVNEPGLRYTVAMLS